MSNETTYLTFRDPQGHLWGVPLMAIAMHRARTLATEQLPVNTRGWQQAYEELIHEGMDDPTYHLVPWADKRMPWADVRMFAVVLEKPPYEKLDMERVWRRAVKKPVTL